MVVHGDDFTFSAADEDLNWAENNIKKWFEVKIRARLGPDPGDDKEAVLLGRIVRVTEKGFEYEADPRHREVILKEFGFDENTKGAIMAGCKEDYGEGVDGGEELGSSEAKSFRGLAARMNYVGVDMPDIQYPVKEVCRMMATPRTTSWLPLKRIARYLVSRTRVCWQFNWCEEVGAWKAVTDSDWAGCVRTRKSTSAGVIMLGQHCIKTWSRNQDAVALSSAEAEYYAMVDGVARAKGLKIAAEELGVGRAGSRHDAGHIRVLHGLECREGDGVEEGLRTHSPHRGSSPSAAGGGSPRTSSRPEDQGHGEPG